MRREPSSETTARCRESGLKAKARMRWLDIFQLATGLDFWFLLFTDLFMWRGWGSESVPLGMWAVVGVGLVSGTKAASSRSLS